MTTNRVMVLIRLEPSLKAKLEKKASDDGRSLNNYLNEVLKKLAK